MKNFVRIIAVLWLCFMPTFACASAKDSVMLGYDAVTASISSGGTATGVIALGGMRLFGVIFPAAMTGTTLSVYVSPDGIVMTPLYDSTGEAVTVPVKTGGAVACDPALFAAWRYVKFISTVTETETRSLTLVLRPI